MTLATAKHLVPTLPRLLVMAVLVCCFTTSCQLHNYNATVTYSKYHEPLPSDIKPLETRALELFKALEESSTSLEEAWALRDIYEWSENNRAAYDRGIAGVSVVIEFYDTDGRMRDYQEVHQQLLDEDKKVKELRLVVEVWLWIGDDCYGEVVHHRSLISPDNARPYFHHITRQLHYEAMEPRPS